jgi:hypothetical protein
MVMALAFAFGGCGPVDPSSLPYLEDEIEIKGVTDEAFKVTIGDLTKLEAVSIHAESSRSNGDIVKVTAVGPTLETFLAQYGKKQTDFSAVRFTSLDGYSIAVPKEALEKREIVLAYMDGGKAFDKDKSAPLRAVVVGERAMYWARMVCSIEFETGKAEQTNKVVFLDTVLPALGADVGAYNEEDKGDAVSTVDILSKYGGLDGGGKVYMAATDGLKKNETIENFLKGALKYTGEHVPQFCSPDLPEGMNMNDIVSIRTGDTVYFSLARGLELYGEKNGSGDAAGRSGVGFSDVVKDLGFARTTNYQMTDAGGQTFIFTEHGMVSGVFAQSEDGTWTFFSEKSGKDVTGVVSVEAVIEEQAD